MASSTQRAAALRTATYVLAAQRAGHATRRRRPPKPQWPWALEREYASDLVGIIGDLRRKTDAALAELPALIESARREREDAADRELLGLHVVIENPAGSIRTWIDADGTTGQTVMRWSHGYLDGYEGADGEDVDVYLGPELEPAEVYVVDQLKNPELPQRLRDRRALDAKSPGNSADRQAAPKQADGLVPIELQDARRSLRGDASTLQTLVDGGVANAVPLRETANRGTSLAQLDRLLEVPVARAAVLAAVVRLLHDDEVRRIVVKAVPVAVVNDLLAGERSAEDALHHYSVLKTLAAALVDESILRLAAERSDVTTAIRPAHEPHHDHASSNVQWVFDEQKCFIGASSRADAIKAFLIHRGDLRAFGGLTVFSVDDFKRSLIANPGRKLTHADPRRARVLRTDVGEGRRVRFLMDRARDGLTSSEAKTEHAAAAIAPQLGDFGKKQLGKQSAAALGVDITPLLTDPKKAAQIDAFVHENVSLIKSLGANTLGELEKLITRGFADGKRAADLGAEIEKRWGITERHARMIARDQVGKLNGQITRARHEELGIAQFRWLTMKDPKVRPTHQPMEGKTFAYKGAGAPPFFPGQEVCCRCLEEPLFDDIMAQLDALMGGPSAEQAPEVIDTSELPGVRAPEAPTAVPFEDTPEFHFERERQAAAKAAAAAAAHEDLASFEMHSAKEKAWAAKVQAAKEKQAKALEELKAKLAAEQAAKDLQEKQAAELAAKKAHEAAVKAAEEAAKKAAEAAKQAADALAAKKSEAAKKAAVTRAANKAKKAAEVSAAAPAPATPAPPPGSVRYSSLTGKDYAGQHGRGFVQDADAIEGGSVRVVKVNGHDGEYFEAVFKVTAPFGEKASSYGTQARPEWSFHQRELRNGELHDQAHSQAMPNASRVRQGARAGNTVEIGTMGALTNQVRIRARSLAELDAAMGDFSRHVGVDLQKEPSRADIELQAKARLAAKFDPKLYGVQMQHVRTPEQHRQVIEAIFAAQAQQHPILHDALRDVRVEEVYPGHKTLYSESLGKHLGKRWKAMYHDGSPPPEVAAKIVGDTGLMSSVKRYNTGVFTTGMSTSADFRTGGADGVFMRVAKTTPSSAGGKFRAVIDTTKVMGRLDWWAFNHDNYGRAGYREYQQRWSVPEQTARTSQAGSGNEVMATHGVPPSAFKKFIVSDESYRQKVLAELRRTGVTEINGQPIDQFVTTQ